MVGDNTNNGCKCLVRYSRNANATELMTTPTRAEYYNLSKFLKYYLVWFIIFDVITLLGYFQIENTDQGAYLLFFITGILCPLLVGKLLDWAENVWTPKRKIKLYHQEPLKSLGSLGFSNHNNDYFIGNIANGELTIQFDHSFRQALIFTLYYSPQSLKWDEVKSITQKIKNAKLKAINCDYPGVISSSIEFYFRVPDIPRISARIEKIKLAVDLLKLEPISKSEYENMFKQKVSSKKV